MIPLVVILPGFVPRFLSMLEEEVYSQNSPIWDQDFMVSSSRTGQLGIQTGNLHLVMGSTKEKYDLELMWGFFNIYVREREMLVCDLLK